MALVPPGARSFDSFSWENQAALMARGGNPYTTGVFNWPPFWMMMCFGISKASAFCGVSFFRVLQLVLISAESVVISLTYYILARRVGKELEIRAFWLILFGLALNPVSVLLVCQHCNFDVFMELWLLAFLISTMNYFVSGEKIDWLLSCLFIGLGILTKQVPLIFLPILLAGVRRVDWKTRILGGFLAIGPVALGVGVIFVMDPVDVGHWVLGYRAVGFSFGFPGLLNLYGLKSLIPIFHFCFYCVGLAVLG
ncbi:MAG TPA: glycosyltransferase 87 family protein, partial [Verrucomicrobiae bacterium]|nr:glycosyltransferase 87 family protein [Verrucomicrobiae bacterium]